MQYAPRHSIAGRAPLSPAGTPRSTRRLTQHGNPTPGGQTPSRNLPPISSLPPRLSLPKLNPVDYPTTHFLEDDTLEDLIASDIQALADAVQRLQASRSARSGDLAREIAAVAEQKREMTAAIRKVGDDAREWGREKAKAEEEEREAKELMGEVGTRQRGLRVQVEAVKADKAEVEAKLAKRREQKQQQRDAFNRQAAKNAPEIAFFEERLGLKIRGQGRDVVRFKFTNVDPGQYDRSFSFDVDASKPTYTLAAVSPAGFLPATTIDSLLARLNQDRDFYGFAVEMREAFRNQVKEERAKRS